MMVRSPPSGQVIAEVLDRVVDAAECDERVSFAALAIAAGLDPARDFRGASLTDLDFRDEDLRGFDFSHADLTGADFRRANLAGVRFEGATLTGAIGNIEPVGSEISIGRSRPDDFVIAQNWQDYSEQEHAIWRLLFERQQRLLFGRACREYLDGLGGLGVEARGIPDFGRLSDVLDAATGWRIVAVPGLVPDDIFFAHLARRRFPATCFIRRRDQLDYLQEPDVFHDICGHVPMLMNPVFADYMQAYGEGGLRASGLGHLQHLARLYWYTVEFGLIATQEGLRIYGSGILSSAGESVYCLADPRPNRVRFDLRRVMRTRYRIDDFQQIYFVIDDFRQLFDATRPDFAPIYREIAALPDIEPDALIASDHEFKSAEPVRG